jgi:large subunit ribosomal protein L13
MNKIIINGDGAILGRLGSVAAKELLKGYYVTIINSENVLISGNEKDILGKIRILRKKGGSSQKGPKFSKLADLLLKRMIRGMLPWDRPKGKMAHKRLLCYVRNGPLTQEEVKKAIDLKHDKPIKFIVLKDIVKLL